MSAQMWILTGVCAFFIGAIPFSWILARLVGGLDIRSVGSGNVGATNVARSLGITVGIAALLLDAGKGVATVLLSRAIAPDDALAPQAVAGGLAVLGHNFTPFLAFRGGKGVATGAGVMGVIAPGVLLVCLGVFLLSVLTTRMVALGSIMAAVALPPATYFLVKDYSVVGLALLLAVLVIVRHRANLTRILRGAEDRIGDREGT